MKTPNICVVGSINMDMTTTASVAPVQGETVLGESFATYPGGKGANQAVAAAKLAKEYGVPVIINPAPFQALPDELLESATYLTPNEIEMNAILESQKGHAVKEKMIVTLGEKGVRFFNQKSFVTAPGYVVEAVDTTGAGDTFNGALAVGIGQGKDLKDAVDAANAAAALSVTKIGAQNGMPTIEQLDRFIADRKKE